VLPVCPNILLKITDEIFSVPDNQLKVRKETPEKKIYTG
jgi:hypothetical protein